MKDLMLVFASMLTEEEIIKQIEEGVAEYRTAEDKKEAKQKIEMYALLLASKGAIDKEKDGVIGLMKKFDKQEKAFRLIDTTEG